MSTLDTNKKILVTGAAALSGTIYREDCWIWDARLLA